MFTERGFALANRIAKAYASSDAVPAQFRLLVMKKVNGQDQWIENPGAIGNCIVAIEVARAVGMSITAVMQNADMIEGKLRWSGKFVIAAINASGRFTPLRFNMRPLGRIKATYQEKTGWDNQARRPTFATREVEIDDVECIAWALPRGFQMPPGVYNLDQARQHNLPIIESAPVTLSLAVEEGWYAKPGSKWRTGLAPLMFQYRAGSFFGNIHAPDIVMGMGPTSEEARDTQVYDLGADGTVDMSAPISAADLRQPTGVRRVDPQTGEIVGQQAAPAQAAAAPPPAPAAPAARAAAQAASATHAAAKAAAPSSSSFDVDGFASEVDKATTEAQLDGLEGELRTLDDLELAGMLNDMVRRRRNELLMQQPAAAPAAAPAPAPTQRRTARAAGQQSIE
ncbi:Gifsy-2 prophage [Piscinibacter sakaiensis]|uniref:Gifsy-2 prophage n=2 Tax=Piscinibacter sakaiensis TaxID=1547922 RepID=A0A0K8P403_PISS1|nr:Gifsy-2 prophage [Piscinibacter sakaiensis]